MIFSSVFERHPRLRVAIVEFELAWALHLLSTMDYTYRERPGEAIYRFKHGMPLEPRSTLRHMGTGRARGIVGLLRSFRRQHREGAHHPAGGSNHGGLQGYIIGQSRV